MSHTSWLSRLSNRSSSLGRLDLCGRLSSAKISKYGAQSYLPAGTAAGVASVAVEVVVGSVAGATAGVGSVGFAASAGFSSFLLFFPLSKPFSFAFSSESAFGAAERWLCQ